MIEKDETTDDMRHGAKLLREANVPYTGYFMAGFPSETDDDLRQTIEFAKEIKADYYSLSILAPYYGTKMYYDMIDVCFELEENPYPNHPAFGIFSKYVNVMGCIYIYAESNISDEKVLHVASVVAELLDNDEDGIVDDLSLIHI